MRYVFVFMAAMLTVFQPALAADAEAFEKQIREIYAEQDSLMSQREIDIPALISFTDKYTNDKAKIISSLLVTNTDETEKTEMTKKDALNAIPSNYGSTYKNRHETNITGMEMKDGNWGASVAYEIKFSTALKREDKIGRQFDQEMHFLSRCTDEWHMSPSGYPQLNRSVCDGAMRYGEPKYISWHKE